MADALHVDSFDDLARLFKALSEPARLRIVLALSERCKSVSAIVGITGLSQPTVSRHLRALRAETVVRGQRVGQFVYYWLQDEAIREIVKMSEEARLRLLERSQDEGARPVLD